MTIKTKKGRDYLLDRFHKARCNVLSCGVYRTEEGNPLVRVTMNSGKIYDFHGKYWHCKIFAKEFRRKILKVYI